MNEPSKRPLDPSTPKSKEIKKYPLNQIYPEPMSDDVYIKPDRDSVYTPINLDKINETLNKIANEDSENSN